MTREQAKIWASIPREKLAVIASHLDKHFDLLCAYANGAEIQSKFRGERDWHTLNSPKFNGDVLAEYRVKPSEAQPAEPWKPKKGEKVFYVSAFGEVKQLEIDNSIASNLIVDFGNCFKTSEEAKAARERASAALKGETVSKTETVESLDGHELSYAEKGVIRILRRCKVETMWNGPFVYLEGQKTLSTCNAGVLFKFELGSKASDFGDLADDVIAEAEERREKGEPSW